MTVARRAYAARVAVDAAVADDATEIPGGVLLSTPGLPDIWDLNQIVFAPGAGAELLESTLASLGASTKRITLFDPADPVPATRGWNLEHCLLMVAGEEPVAWPDGVETVPSAALHDARRLTYDKPDETDQVIEMIERFASFPGSITVAMPSGEAWAAWAVVANGSIDDVWVQPEFRRRGLGRAVSQAALAAGGWFLWTDAADPVPQGLYRSLGMREIGTVVQLTRQPG